MTPEQQRKATIRALWPLLAAERRTGRRLTLVDLQAWWERLTRAR